jgi:Ribonuclease G/E
MEKELKDLIEKINDLGFDYDRMSGSGQETYDQIQEQMSKLMPKIAEAIELGRKSNG